MLPVKDYSEDQTVNLGVISTDTDSLEQLFHDYGVEDTEVRELPHASSLFYLTRILDVTPFIELGADYGSACHEVERLVTGTVNNPTLLVDCLTFDEDPCGHSNVELKTRELKH